MRRVILRSLVVSLAGMLPLIAQNQNSQGDDQGGVLIPGSSIENPGDQGKNSHTNHLIHFRGNPHGTTPSGFSPSQLATAYGLGTSMTLGLGKTIAIVDAYDYPTAENDLNVFSSWWRLPACTTNNGCFKLVYATKQPKANCGWAQEAALDIEWAHAMAPDAKIVLVEAASNSNADLFAAVDIATRAVVAGGGGAVSMSWGGSESSGETVYETHFNGGSNGGSNVIYFAASGDAGGKTIYPGTSPYVVSAGGTSLKLNPDYTIQSEMGWSGSGGGTSPYFGRPSYQDNIISIVGTQRGVPDFSFVADPYTGVSVYDSTRCTGMEGWMVFGGTSVSSPSLAGIVTAAHPASSTTSELGNIYSGLGNPDYFNDITSGTAGMYSATKGWDFVTGVGSNNGLFGK
jgi:subtilase family serine protease